MSKHDHDVYSARARTYNPEKEWFVHGLDLLAERKDAHPPYSALDVGCGHGEWADLLLNLYPGSTIHGVDYAEPHLAAMREKGHPVTRLDFDDSSAVEAFASKHEQAFDLVTLFEVIEHIFDVDALLAMIHQVLKPGGLLIISTPNVGYISYRLFTMCRGNLPPSEGHHVRFFDQRRLEQVCWINGFTPGKSSPFGKGNFYLDRAADPLHQRFRTWILDVVFRLVHFLFKKRHTLVRAGLLLSCRKSDAPPLGLDPTHRESALTSLTPKQIQTAVDRLRPLAEKGFFAEHPSLTDFLNSQSDNAAKTSTDS